MQKYILSYIAPFLKTFDLRKFKNIFFLTNLHQLLRPRKLFLSVVCTLELAKKIRDNSEIKPGITQGCFTV